MKLKKLIFTTFTAVLLWSATAHAEVTDAAGSNNSSTSSKYHFKYSHKSFISLEGGTWGRGKGWTYTKPDGTLAIGWTLIDGDYHYFDENGWMYMECTTPDGYYVDENGVLSMPEANNAGSLKTNIFTGEWVKDSKGWKYNNGDGTYPKSSWHWIDGNNDGIAECYYFDPEGYLVTNLNINGHQVNSDGAMLTSYGKVNTLEVTSDWNEDYISGQFEFRYYDEGRTRYYDPTESEKWVALKMKDASTITVTFNDETIDYFRVEDTIYENMQTGNSICIAYDGDIYIHTDDKSYFYSKC